MKYDVDKYLGDRKMKRNDLDKDIQPMLVVYDKIMELHKKREDTGEHLAQANKVGKSLIAEIKKIYPEPKKSKAAVQSSKKTKQEKAQKIIEKTPVVIDELLECKKLIKKAREKKIKSGEIKAPVKQTRYTKIKNSMVRILKSIPGQNVSNITTTRDALIASARKIFNAHGWKQWKLIDNILKEVADKKIAKLQNTKE